MSSNWMPFLTTVGFSVLALAFLAVAAMGFSGRGASFFMGRNGSETYKEKEYLRFHGWLGVVLFFICAFAVLGIRNEWASSALVLSAMLLPYLIIMIGYRYLKSSGRFRRDAENSEIPDRNIRAHGLSFLALLYAMPLVLFFAAIIGRYYGV